MQGLVEDQTGKVYTYCDLKIRQQALHEALNPKPPTTEDEPTLLHTHSSNVRGGPVTTLPTIVPPTLVTQGSLPG